jgi:L-amino acid N-acyltransferase YncA
MIAIRPATESDLPAILAIYNDAVLNTVTIWNDTPADLESRRAWLRARNSQSYPVLVAVLEGQVAGYASYGDFRLFEGYRFTVEHSVYVAEGARRRGVAARLMQTLIEHARASGKHVMIGGIEAENAASLALHAKLGFSQTARIPEVGRKFDRWLDLVFVQKIL